MNHFEQMIAMINDGRTVFTAYRNEEAEILHARSQYHMPDIYFILSIDATNGMSAGWSTWYFDKEGKYLGSVADG